MLLQIDPEINNKTVIFQFFFRISYKIMFQIVLLFIF